MLAAPGTGINLPVDAGFLAAAPWSAYGGRRDWTGIPRLLGIPATRQPGSGRLISPVAEGKPAMQCFPIRLLPLREAQARCASLHCRVAYRSGHYDAFSGKLVGSIRGETPPDQLGLF